MNPMFKYNFCCCWCPFACCLLALPLLLAAYAMLLLMMLFHSGCFTSTAVYSDCYCPVICPFSWYCDHPSAYGECVFFPDVLDLMWSLYYTGLVVAAMLLRCCFYYCYCDGQTVMSATVVVLTHWSWLLSILMLQCITKCSELVLPIGHGFFVLPLYLPTTQAKDLRTSS